MSRNEMIESLIENGFELKKEVVDTYVYNENVKVRFTNTDSLLLKVYKDLKCFDDVNDVYEYIENQLDLDFGFERL